MDIGQLTSHFKMAKISNKYAISSVLFLVILIILYYSSRSKDFPVISNSILAPKITIRYATHDQKLPIQEVPISSTQTETLFLISAICDERLCENFLLFNNTK